jgi:sugar phosphate isomerase/epimerase
MHLGYNTNGFAGHALEEIIELLAGIGYRSIAITLDHHVLNPFSPRLERQLECVCKLLAETGLRSVIETGARFLLDPARKHEPTLMTADEKGRARRIDFLWRAIDIAAVLGSDCVSLWSGAVHDRADVEGLWGRLTSGLEPVLDYAARQQVVLAFEPEPDMYVDTTARYGELLRRLGPGVPLKLTLDIGHLQCLDELPIADVIRRWGQHAVNVHIEDMRRGLHQHLMFGEGEIDFPAVIAALAEVGYEGGLQVELSRHADEGPTAAQRAYAFLHPLVISGA